MSDFKGLGIVFLKKHLKNKKPEAFETFLSKLNEQEKIQFEKTIATTWLPLKEASSMFEKAAEIMHSNKQEGLVTLGTHMADDNLKGLYKALVRVSSVPFIMQRAGSLWKMYHNRGEAYSENKDKNSAIFAVKNYENMPESFKLLMVGYIRKVMEITGVKGISVELEQSNNPVVWNISWN